jgi:hypothetical protein
MFVVKVQHISNVELDRQPLGIFECMNNVMIFVVVMHVR